MLAIHGKFNSKAVPVSYELFKPMKRTGKKIIIIKKDSPLYDYEIERIEILGSGTIVDFDETEDGFLINLPEGFESSEYATTFKIVGGDLKYTDLAIR